MKIAITGGIGSGKSYVCQRLHELYGTAIYDCDAAAKRLMNTSPSLREQLVQLIGGQVYTAQGRLNKAEMARFLLASPDHTQTVNGIVHPAVATDFQQSGLQWMECAILFESGFNRLVDVVVAVSAPSEVRLERIMQRDGIAREKALEWMSSQWPQQDVLQRADFIIENDGLRDVDAQLDSLMQRLAALSPNNETNH